MPSRSSDESSGSPTSSPRASASRRHSRWPAVMSWRCGSCVPPTSSGRSKCSSVPVTSDCSGREPPPSASGRSAPQRSSSCSSPPSGSAGSTSKPPGNMHSRHSRRASGSASTRYAPRRSACWPRPPPWPATASIWSASPTGRRRRPATPRSSRSRGVPVAKGSCSTAIRGGGRMARPGHHGARLPAPRGAGMLSCPVAGVARLAWGSPRGCGRRRGPPARRRGLPSQPGIARVCRGDPLRRGG